jgi:hypothetical protein
VLREFKRSVGEEEFKRLFARYFAPENRIVMEAAIGPRRGAVPPFVSLVTRGEGRECPVPLMFCRCRIPSGRKRFGFLAN